MTHVFKYHEKLPELARTTMKEVGLSRWQHEHATDVLVLQQCGSKSNRPASIMKKGERGAWQRGCTSLVFSENVNDQPHVHCREGIVKVINLQLNRTLLNDKYLANSGIILDSFSVVELEAKISYTHQYCHCSVVDYLCLNISVSWKRQSKLGETIGFRPSWSPVHTLSVCRKINVSNFLHDNLMPIQIWAMRINFS